MAGAGSMLGHTTRVSAYVLCRDGERVLVTRAKSPHRSAWSLPGGPLVFGEDPAVAARREMLADTGMVARLGPVIGIDSLRVVQPTAQGSLSAHETHAVRVVYSGRVVGALAAGAGDAPVGPFSWLSVEALSQRPRSDLVDTALAWAIPLLPTGE